MKFSKNVSLKNYTTFKIGGSARYFFIAKTKKDLILAVQFARENKIPFFILGNGSNLLASDKGFKGLVIKMENAKWKMQNGNAKCKIICETGLPLGKLVSLSLKNNLTDLEWAVGIPGTVGGAIAGNAGAFDKSMARLVKDVEVFDVGKGKILNFKNKECGFSYRESIFKKKKNLIILSVVLELEKKDKNKIKGLIKKYSAYRRATQPLNFPSIGSIFKNPKGYSAAKLIQDCSLKGKQAGQAQVSPKHANFIVNLGGARAKDVVNLINLIKKTVKKRFRINLEEEIQYLGF